MATRRAGTGALTAVVACLALLLVGVAWIVTTYMTGARFPIPGVGNLNLAVGAALTGLGLVAGVIAIILAVISAANGSDRDNRR